MDSIYKRVKPFQNEKSRSGLVSFTDDEYELRENSYCHPYDPHTLSNVFEAKRECTEDPSCTMFTETGGQGKQFNLCQRGSNIISSGVGSMVHIKTRGKCQYSFMSL